MDRVENDDDAVVDLRHHATHAADIHVREPTNEKPAIRAIQDHFRKCFRSELSAMRSALKRAAVEFEMNAEDSSAEITLYQIFSILLFEEERDLYVKALSDHSVKKLNFLLGGDSTYMTFIESIGPHNLELANSLQCSTDDVAGAFSPFARGLGDLTSLETLDFACAGQFTVLTATIIRGCRQIKDLSLDFSGDEDEVENAQRRKKCYAYLYQSVEYHPTIETMTVDFGAHSFQVACRAMATLPKLSKCTMIRLRSSRFVIAHEDAEALRDLLLAPALIEVESQRLHFSDKGDVENICSALVTANLEVFTACCWICPCGSEEILLDAVMNSEIYFFGLMPSASSVQTWIEPLRRAMPQSTRIETLLLGNTDDPWASDALCLALSSSKQWSVREIDLNVTEWNEDIEVTLSEYVKWNESIREVSLTLPKSYCSAAFKSELLLAAVDSGVRRLECLSFYVVEDDKQCPAEVESNWHGRLQHVLELNRTRNLVEPEFVAITRADSELPCPLHLVEALECIDMVTLFEFLRRNEWGMQGLVQSLGREIENCVAGRSTTTGSRKRTVDSIY